MSDVNPGAKRINELIRNYTPPRSADETEITWECAAERVAMALGMPSPEGQVDVIPGTNRADVGRETHGSIYMCDEYAPFEDLGGGVTMVTEDKEQEKESKEALLKTEILKVWEEHFGPSEIDYKEPPQKARVSHRLETVKEGDREKTDREEKMENGEGKMMMEKQKGFEETNEETKVNVVKNADNDKVVQLKTIIEEDLPKEEKKEKNGARIEMVKGEEGELEVMDEEKLKGGAKVDPQVQEMRTDETRAELEDANGGEVKGIEENSKGKEQVTPKKITNPFEEAKANEFKSEGEKRRDGEIEEFGDVKSKVEEEVAQNGPVEELKIKDEWKREEKRKDKEVGEMKLQNQLKGDGDAVLNWAIEEGEIQEQEEDEQDLTSWSSISDLDTTSLLSSISSLSFGEIISISGEEDGELTADEIEDEVWGDDINADYEDDITEDDSITSKTILPDGDETTLHTADDKDDLITVCPTEVGSTRRGFWSRIFARRQSKKDKKAKKIAAEQETKQKKSSKMAAIIFACCCVQPSD